MTLSANYNMKTLFTTYFFKNVGLFAFAASFSLFFDWLRMVTLWDHMPIRLLGVLTLLITIDFVTGMVAAKRQKEKLTSRKAWRTPIKIVVYVVFIHTIVALEQQVQGSVVLISIATYVKLTALTLGLLSELGSWGENLEKIYGDKLRIFKFLDLVAEAFERLLIRKIDNIGKEEDK